MRHDRTCAAVTGLPDVCTCGAMLWLDASDGWSLWRSAIGDGADGGRESNGAGEILAPVTRAPVGVNGDVSTASLSGLPCGAKS